jgi:hypothetical protein
MSFNKRQAPEDFFRLHYLMKGIDLRLVERFERRRESNAESY